MLATPRPSAEPAEPLTQDRGKILVVDDDATLVELLTMRLERQGYETVSAYSGREGLEVAQTHRPNLVLLDLRLPDANGLEVCEQLADAPETSHIPVIILSGMERPDIIRRSRAAGCQYFVRKPYDPNALLILIRHALQEQSEWDQG